MSGIGGRGGGGGKRNRGRNGRNAAASQQSPSPGISPADRQRHDSGNGSVVDAIREGVAAVQVDEKKTEPAVMIGKVPPGSRGQEIRVKTNVWGLIPPRKVPVFRYDFRVTADFGQNARQKELTKQIKEDYPATERREKVLTVFKHLVSTNKDFFSGGVYSLVTDRASILYSITKFALKEAEEKRWNLAANIFDDNLGLGDSCLGIVVVIKPVEENFSIVMDQFQASIIPDLDKQDHSLQQFFELATSQAIFFEGDHVAYGSQSFLLDEQKYGFGPGDCPDLGDGKYLAVGSDKSIRFIEGPSGAGNVNVAVVVDLKKAAFHRPHNVVDKVAELLSLDTESLKRQTISDARQRYLSTQLKDLYVETRYGKNRKFQIARLSQQSADNSKFADKDGKQQTVTQYFFVKYKQKLDYGNLPCLMERKPGPQNEYSLFPMELCYIGDNQRVNQSKQTPAQMDKMIKACATAPIDRQRQMEQVMTAAKLHDQGKQNNWLANQQMRLTAKSLSASARHLPSGTAEYQGHNGKVPIHARMGNWKAMTNPYYMPATCPRWIMIGLGKAQDRYSLRQHDLQSFKTELVKFGRNKGMNIPEPDNIHMVEGSETALETVFKQCNDNIGFIFCVQLDRLEYHNQLKLLEVQYQIGTQDLKMSTARGILGGRKGQTLENVVNKFNMKLGGLNYNLLLESAQCQKWLSDNSRLILGLDMSVPPALSVQEKARGLKPKTPCVVGYAANMNRHPFEFVGGAMYQESEKDQAITVLYRIGEEVLLQYYKSREQFPANVIVYRAGVSEGQYKTVLQKEVPMLRKAFSAVGQKLGVPAYNPKLTIMVVQKRHNIRLYNEQINPRDKPADQNIPCGTVLDRYIVHPTFTEFYLNSHRAPQGTTKPAKYTVVLDDDQSRRIGSDELQGLSYALCLGHQIVSMAISLPVPLYVASTWTVRGKNNFSEKTHDDLSSDSAVSSSSTAAGWAEISNELSYARKALAQKRVNA